MNDLFAGCSVADCAFVTGHPGPHMTEARVASWLLEKNTCLTKGCSYVRGHSAKCFIQPTPLIDRYWDWCSNPNCVACRESPTGDCHDYPQVTIHTGGRLKPAAAQLRKKKGHDDS